VTDYNYKDFEMAREMPPFDEFRTRLFVGEKAPDFPLEDLATGDTVQLSSLWKKGPAIIEFGSFT
jgi:hypothetical protein